MYTKRWSQLSYGTLVALFIVAFLCGAAAKYTIGHYVRNGFNDPSTVISRGTLYDLDKTEEQIIEKNALENEQ